MLTCCVAMRLTYNPYLVSIHNGYHKVSFGIPVIIGVPAIQYLEGK